MDTKTRILNAFGSLSGAASILGSWQVCHNLCLGVIALLGVFGVTLTGMPFLFLTEIVVPVWLVAVSLLAASIYLYHKKGCISRGLLLINTGLLVAGTPFVPQLRVLYWVFGVTILLIGIYFWRHDKT